MNYPPNHQKPLTASEAVTGLAAGTLVTTPDGEKRIEEVKAGDLVLSGVGSGKTKFHEVKKVMSKHHVGLMMRIETSEGNQLQITPNHVCFAHIHQDMTSDGSIMIDAFQHDDKKSSQPVHLIRSDVKIIGQSYNLDDAVEIARQIAVSNGGAEIEMFAKFGDDHCRFMSASELEVGLTLPLVCGKYEDSFVGAPFHTAPEIPTPLIVVIYNGYKETIIEDWLAEITSITEEQYEGLVYALDVPEARNFAANGVLVYDSTLVEFLT